MSRSALPLFGVVATAALVACGVGGGEPEPVAGPRVDLIPAALEAVEEHYGAAPEYFEVSADLESVGFVIAVDGATAAEQGSFAADGTFMAPQPVGEASGFTFVAAQIAVDERAIFTQLRDELDDPVIIDFAIQGGQEGGVVYDATVASDDGGVLLVLLSADGTIQGVQGQ